MGWGASPTPRPPLLPRKNRYLFYRRLDGPQCRSGRAENLVHTGIRSRTVQAVGSRYTVWATWPHHVKCSVQYYLEANDVLIIPAVLQDGFQDLCNITQAQIRIQCVTCQNYFCRSKAFISFSEFCVLNVTEITSYSFFWVIPRGLNFIFRRFGTLSVPSS